LKKFENNQKIRKSKFTSEIIQRETIIKTGKIPTPSEEEKKKY
jgi:hypothetical protein